MTFLRSPDQRCAAVVLRLLPLHPGLAEELGHLEVPRVGGMQQRCGAVRVCLVHTRSGLHQQRHDLHVPSQRGSEHRALAFPVNAVRVRLSRQRPLNRKQIPPQGGVHEAWARVRLERQHDHRERERLRQVDENLHVVKHGGPVHQLLAEEGRRCHLLDALLQLHDGRHSCHGHPRLLPRDAVHRHLQLRPLLSSFRADAVAVGHGSRWCLALMRACAGSSYERSPLSP
mmetsp:Transcript_90936/g.284407  ORF Transcript_90936/g.284407 Transcript_90936/m.284407 type:complete len:229 (+) Transcript_90936:1064-1750(+)